MYYNYSFINVTNFKYCITKIKCTDQTLGFSKNAKIKIDPTLKN